jgi:hypothetical protein
MLMRLDTVSVRCLFCSVAANRHVAPAPRITPRMVGENERAGEPLTRLRVRKVLGADQLSQRLCDGEQKRVKVAPATQDLKSEAPLTRRRKGDAAEGFVALEQAAKRRQLSESLGSQGAALMPTHEDPEPFPQAPRLIRNLVKLAGERTRAHVPKNVAWDQVGLLEPVQIAVAIIKPIEGGIDFRGDLCRP